MARKPMFKGLDLSAVTDITPIDMTWDYIKRLRDIWPRKLIVKGIVTREDAELAVQHGLDGLVVSNHGGRAGTAATQRSKASVVAGIGAGCRAGRQRLPPRLRRFQALALGATAVAAGPTSETASFGRRGVERSSTSCARVDDRHAPGGTGHRRDQPSYVVDKRQG
jgi:hypothetical protein